MNEMPHELALGDVYFSPALPVFSLSLLETWLTLKVFNKLRLSRYIMFPSLTFLSLMLVYMLMMNAYWIRI